MSTESSGGGGAVPSFGDLFDEPEAPVGAETAAPAPAPPASAAAPAPAPAPAEDVAPATAAAPLDEPADEPEFVAPLVGLDDEGPGPVSDDAGDAAPPQQAAESAWSSGAALAGMDDDIEPESPAAASPDLAPSLAAAAGAAAMAAPVQTGRLFRSTGAEGPATLDAIPAIDPEYMAAREAQRAAEARKAPKERPARDAAAVQGSSGLTWTGVVVIVLLGTVLVAFADAIINDSLGILTGIALLVSSVYCALLVRRADIWAAVVVPPLAFLAAALTAGQLTLDSAGSFVVREGYMLLKTLAQNAPWVIGTTVVCLVIVLVRLRRTSTAEHA